MDPKMFFRKCVTSEVSIYKLDERKPDLVELDLVTSPFGPSKMAYSKLKTISKERDIHFYPKPAELPTLMNELARFTNIKEENIMLTAGADQAIEIIFIHLLDPKDKIAIHVPTFPRFEIVARKLCDANVLLFDDLNRIPKDVKVVCLCTPNNPTTEKIPDDVIFELLVKNKNKMFVVDAAFSEFERWDPEKFVNKFSNLIAIQSFSKGFGFAGLRVGYIISDKKNIMLLKEGISPFRVSYLAQKLALESLRDKKHLKSIYNFIKKEGLFIKKEFGDNMRWESFVPFYLLNISIDSTLAREKLLKENIAVTDGKHFKGLSGNWLRVRIGLHKENELFINAIRKLNLLGG